MVLDRVRPEVWARPRTLWAAFGGQEGFPNAPTPEVPAGGYALPHWLDDRARKDGIIPFAVSVLLASPQIGDASSTELFGWLRELLPGLNKEPPLLSLARDPSVTLLQIMAKPLAACSRVTSCVRLLLQDSSDVRLSARFARLGTAPVYVDYAAAVVEVSVTVLNLIYRARFKMSGLAGRA